MKQGLRRKAYVLGLTLGLLLAMAGCGGSGGGGATDPTPSNNPVPAVSSISPTSAMVGTPAETLTINGTNFMNTSTVTYNNAGHTATFVSATQLSISLSASDQAAAGTYSVMVTNPAPGGGNSAAANFTVNNLVPTISSIAPASATAGAAAKTLTINGTNFLGTSTVTYNDAARAATYVSATKLTISLSTSDQATAGSYAVVVTNPAPGGGVSKSQDFTVNPASNVKVSITNPSTPASVTVGRPLTLVASVAGTTDTAVNWSVNNIADGNSTLGTITGGTATTVIYNAPAAIPGGDNPVTITATSKADDTQSDSIMVTVNPSTSAPTAVSVSAGGPPATGINFALTTFNTTLGLANVGTCIVGESTVSCVGSVAGIQVSQSGAATASCPNATCVVWLLGQGLTNEAGDTVTRGLTVTVSHGSTADAAVTPGSVTAYPICTAMSQPEGCGLTAIYFTVKVSSTQALGNRDIVATVGSGATLETQAYFGAIQIVQ